MGINIQSIRASFDLIRPFAEEFSDRFYQNLFQDYPEAKPLFGRGDMQAQRAMLGRALVVAVDHLDNAEELTRLLLALSELHVRQGVQTMHYAFIRASLLKTLGECLGERWTQDLRMQWSAVYDLLAEAVHAGAKSVAEKSPKLQAETAQKEGENSMNHDAPLKSQLPSELFAELRLPEHLKAQIHRSVEAAVLELIRAEVQRCYDEQIRNIEKMTTEELVRLAG